MPKDYYIILGIGRGADLGQIKQAYRTIAKTCHPDLAPAPDPEKFREIQEAYETLSDRDSRRRYDDRLEHDEVPVRVARKPKRGRQRLEPLRRRRRPMDMPGLFDSAVEEFFEGALPGFALREKSGPTPKDLYFEVVLSPAEAREGCMAPIHFPVIEPCPGCRQGDFGDPFFCPTCGGAGRVRGERRFSLSIPPNTPHGTSVGLSLEDIGLPGVGLHVNVVIDPSM